MTKKIKNNPFPKSLIRGPVSVDDRMLVEANDNKAGKVKKRNKTVNVVTNLPDKLPIVTGELELFERYFLKLLAEPVANDNEG